MALIPSQAYAKSGGMYCPVCTHTNIQGESFDTELGTCTQCMYCTDCGASWTDCYVLVGYANLKEGEGELE